MSPLAFEMLSNVKSLVLSHFNKKWRRQIIQIIFRFTVYN